MKKHLSASLLAALCGLAVHAQDEISFQSDQANDSGLKTTYISMQNPEFKPVDHLDWNALKGFLSNEFVQEAGCGVIEELVCSKLYEEAWNKFYQAAALEEAGFRFPSELSLDEAIWLEKAKNDVPVVLQSTLEFAVGLYHIANAEKGKRSEETAVMFARIGAVASVAVACGDLGMAAGPEGAIAGFFIGTVLGVVCPDAAEEIVRWANETDLAGRVLDFMWFDHPFGSRISSAFHEWFYNVQYGENPHLQDAFLQDVQESQISFIDSLGNVVSTTWDWTKWQAVGAREMQHLLDRTAALYGQTPPSAPEGGCHCATTGYANARDLLGDAWRRWQKAYGAVNGWAAIAYASKSFGEGMGLVFKVVEPKQFGGIGSAILGRVNDFVLAYGESGDVGGSLTRSQLGDAKALGNGLRKIASTSWEECKTIEERADYIQTILDIRSEIRKLGDVNDVLSKMGVGSATIVSLNDILRHTDTIAEVGQTWLDAYKAEREAAKYFANVSEAMKVLDEMKIMVPAYEKVMAYDREQAGICSCGSGCTCTHCMKTETDNAPFAETDGEEQQPAVEVQDTPTVCTPNIPDFTEPDWREKHPVWAYVVDHVLPEILRAIIDILINHPDWTIESLLCFDENGTPIIRDGVPWFNGGIDESPDVSRQNDDDSDASYEDAANAENDAQTAADATNNGIVCQCPASVQKRKEFEELLKRHKAAMILYENRKKLLQNQPDTSALEKLYIDIGGDAVGMLFGAATEEVFKAMTDTIELYVEGKVSLAEVLWKMFTRIGDAIKGALDDAALKTFYGIDDKLLDPVKLVSKILVKVPAALSECLFYWYKTHSAFKEAEEQLADLTRQLNLAREELLANGGCYCAPGCECPHCKQHSGDGICLPPDDDDPWTGGGSWGGEPPVEVVVVPGVGGSRGGDDDGLGELVSELGGLLDDIGDGSGLVDVTIPDFGLSGSDNPLVPDNIGDPDITFTASGILNTSLINAGRGNQGSVVDGNNGGGKRKRKPGDIGGRGQKEVYSSPKP